MPNLNRRSLLQSLGCAAMFTSFAQLSNVAEGGLATSGEVEEWLKTLYKNA